jgi:drug/metabolite transporter (DMT)-like permease
MKSDAMKSTKALGRWRAHDGRMLRASCAVLDSPIPSANAANSRFLAYGCLALSMALVGSYVALSKPLAAAIPVFLLAWLRFGIGGLAMLHWLRKPAHEAPMTGQTKRLLFLESFFGNFLFSLCMLFGLSLTSAVSAGIIMASIPAVVALMSWALLRERIGLRIWIAATLAGAGIGMLALHQPPSATTSGAATTHWLGNALVFSAVLCEAAYAVIGKKLTGALGAKRITSLINLWGFLLVTPFGAYVAMSFDFASVAAEIWLLLLFYSLAASVWTVWLWMTGLKRVPAAQGGVFTVMLPISAVAVGVLVLGESLRAGQLVAFALALAGVLVATLPVRAAPVR